MQLINFPDQIYPANNSLGWTFPIKIRGVETAHGYTTTCPDLADDPTKANGTVTILIRGGDDDGTVATDADDTALEDLPVTALESGGTSLEFTLYTPLDTAQSYQMQAFINIPDPDNEGEFLQFKVLENFQISDKAI
jgi:hypothetical protein